MRQVGGEPGDIQPRPRKRSSVDLGPSIITSNNPTSFFLGNERNLQTRLDENKGERRGSNGAMDTQSGDSEYGVRSLEDVEVEPSAIRGSGDEKLEISHTTRPMTPRRRSTLRATNTFRDQSIGELSAVSGLTSEASSPGRDDTTYQTREGLGDRIRPPLSPLSRPSPHLGTTATGSPRSISVQSLRHPDDEYENSSQAVFSSEDDDSMRDHHIDVSAPGPAGLQLVMPSLTLPSRRPFTDRGRNMGKLKLLFAGSSGSGKTSLIKSFVQTCNEIVHIDPLSPGITESGSQRKGKSRASTTSTKKIAEIVASTKPYPNWWSELEESQILRRRKSSGEEVLERNVCFIDTPGYDNGSSMLEGMDAILQYIESQMKLTISTSAMHDNDLLSILAGSGGMQVDAVLYLLPAHPKPIDLEFLRQLSKLTNVIPLLSKIDLLQDEKHQLRAHILDQIRSADIPLVAFPDGFPQVFDVCSSPSNDLESMDASLLMSSDFVQPLHDSDLPLLIDYLFDSSSSTFLKHLAAKKLVEWRKTPSTRSFALTPSPMRTDLFSPTMPLSSSVSSSGRHGHAAAPLSPTSAALTYTSARLTDHKRREEQMAQINLGNWAEGLRRNLAAERARYESIANAEREKWLRERLQECVFDSNIVTTDRALTSSTPRNQISDLYIGLTKGQNRSRAGRHDAMDPFAIMFWRRQALTAMHVIGGFGVLGAVALWAARTWELDWQWLDDYGFSRLQSLFGGNNAGMGSAAGGSMGRIPSD